MIDLKALYERVKKLTQKSLKTKFVRKSENLNTEQRHSLYLQRIKNSIDK